MTNTIRFMSVSCAALGVGTAECLFVGDRPDIDVAGARGVGMAAAWLNPAGLPLPEGLPARVTVTDLFAHSADIKPPSLPDRVREVVVFLRAMQRVLGGL